MGLPKGCNIRGSSASATDIAAGDDISAAEAGTDTHSEPNRSGISVKS
jgi:hypothetical protein